MIPLFFTNISSAAPGIWDIPENIQPWTYKTYPEGNIIVKEIRYVSSAYKNKPVVIFGYYCYPKNKKNLPGVVAVHGGGGYATLSRSLKYAHNGYAALSIDLPGKGPLRWNKSRSTGPDMDVPTLLRVSPDISYNYLYHAVRAARCAISFLELQPEVDKSKIGMAGFSWGGVITLITNGVDKRLAAAVPVFGSGYLDQGSTWQARFDEWMSEANKETYNKYFDAKNYLGTQHAPVLYMTGTNDHCFYIPNFIKTYRNIPENQADLAVYANGIHKVTPDMQDNIYSFLDSKLKGGSRFPKIKIGEIAEKGGFISLPISYKGPYPAKEINLYYSKSGISSWTIKRWEKTTAKLYKGNYYVDIPKGIISPEILFYAGLKDSRGAYVSTPIQALMRFKISDGRILYVPTTPVEEIDYHRLSPKSWEKITQKKCDIVGDSILFGNLERIGAKVTAQKYWYYIKLP